MDLRATVRDEYERRRARNPRYSLRAFARSLGTHRSTLARILDRRRGLTERAALALCARLGLPAALAVEARLGSQADGVLRALAAPGARLDSRWLATRCGIPLDDVNRALQRLLRERRLRVRAPGTWTCDPEASR